jgi:hypothetical protein
MEIEYLVLYLNAADGTVFVPGYFASVQVGERLIYSFDTSQVPVGGLQVAPAQDGVLKFQLKPPIVSYPEEGVLGTVVNLSADTACHAHMRIEGRYVPKSELREIEREQEAG